MIPTPCAQATDHATRWCCWAQAAVLASWCLWGHKPTANPLDNPQVHMLLKLTKPLEEVYLPYVLQKLHCDPTSFESACRGVHQGFPAVGAFAPCDLPIFISLNASCTAPTNCPGGKRLIERSEARSSKTFSGFWLTSLTRSSLGFYILLLLSRS